MHSNISITDEVYGMLSDDDVAKRINDLAQTGSNADLNALASIAKRILDQIKASKDNILKKENTVMYDLPRKSGQKRK